ncbi:hypothetical protein HMPREF0972_01655 [Actinomyces sp. oral taxon 848 str. F0332]|nr:hypothetical protein HMPREF0972_01655 [Actinomyces sp. oral taxon 848 str. F0332]
MNIATACGNVEATPRRRKTKGDGKSNSVGSGGQAFWNRGQTRFEQQVGLSGERGTRAARANAKRRLNARSNEVQTMKCGQ